MTTKTRRSLRRTLATALLRGVLCTLALAGSYALVSHLVPPTLTMVPPESPASAAPSVVEVRVESLIDRHDCWTGEAPEGVEIPGGVVLQERGGVPRYYSSDAMVGGALDHLFTAPDPTLVRVFAFCR